MRRWRCVLLAAFLVAPVGRAQAVNPLGADPLAGTFAGEKFTLTLRPDAGGRYTGVIRMGAQEFPATASREGVTARGSFTSGGKAFAFTASLAGETLTLSTDGATYALKKSGGAAPGARDPAAGQWEVLRETPTGRTLFATRPGSRSAKEALAGASRDLAAYLGERPVFAGAFADAKDLRAGASFNGRLKDRAVKGMVFVGVGERGAAVTVAYDAADAPRANRAALDAAFPAETRWEDVRLPDGSGSMKLPAGWRITSASKGAVDAVGPGGQTADLGLAYPVNAPEAEQAWLQSQAAAGVAPRPSGLPVVPYHADPVRALEAMVPVFSQMSQAGGGPAFRLVRVIESTPMQFPNGNGAMVHAVVERGSGRDAVRYRSLAVSVPLVIGGGQWMFYTSYVSAPEATFERDLPTLLQVWASWRVSDQTIRERLAKAMADMRETGEIWRRSQAAAEKVRDNANADFVEVIRGYRTVEDATTGERREADLGNVDRVVEKMNQAEGWERYKPIPLRDQ